jgi:hypothetical protein
MGHDFLNIVAQFGPAGLIGLLWIAERRHAAMRDRQLSEAHRRLSAQDQAADALLNVVKDNTRAIVMLEHTQRELIDWVRAMAGGAVSR